MAKSNFSIAVLISGSGTTLRNLIEYDQAGKLDAKISLVICSNPKATGTQYAEQQGIEVVIVDHRSVKEPDFSDTIFDSCRAAGVDMIVMAGFLRKLTIPDSYQNRVINIHPSLIPVFSGKGFYGSKVHQAAIDFGCKVSGCTVHLVDNQYDHGPIVAQRVVEVSAEDTSAVLAARVFEQECILYPQIINQFANGQVKLEGRRVTVLKEKTTV